MKEFNKISTDWSEGFGCEIIASNKFGDWFVVWWDSQLSEDDKAEAMTRWESFSEKEKVRYYKTALTQLPDLPNPDEGITKEDLLHYLNVKFNIGNDECLVAEVAKELQIDEELAQRKIIFRKVPPKTLMKSKEKCDIDGRKK